MNLHKKARLTPLRREEMAVAVIEGGLSKAEAARRYGVCPKIVSRWVERFIQTALRGWAYARAYPTSDHRKAHLPDWTHMYNWHRPHGSLDAKTPIGRLNPTSDNLLKLQS